MEVCFRDLALTSGQHYLGAVLFFGSSPAPFTSLSLFHGYDFLCSVSYRLTICLVTSPNICRSSVRS